MLLNDDQRIVLTFIREVNDGGFSPSVEDVTEWFERPDILPGKVTVEKIETSIPAVLSPSIRDTILKLTDTAKIMDSVNKSFSNQMRQAVGPGTAWAQLAAAQPRTRTRREPDETVIEQMTRLHWITTNSTATGLRLTDLGKALLRAERQRSSSDNVLVLKDDGPLAWGALLAEIGDAGNCTIVDPYLRAPELARFMEFATIRRVIIGPRLTEKGDLVRLRVLLRDTPSEVDVRIGSHDMHDRFIVGDHAVYSLGVSANIVGKKVSVLNRMSGDAADSLRAVVQTWWDTGAPLVTPDPEVEAVTDAEPSAGGE